MPKISVIVPVYNAEKYLRRCIDSILNQTFTDFELLLIDDGSTDGSGLLCDKYAAKDKRIRVFHKENGGVSSARNIGLENARGEWIAFADIDDKVSSNWLFNMVELCLGKELIIQGFYPTLQKDLKTSGQFERCELPTGAALSYLYECDSLGYIWNKLFRNDIIKKNHLRFCTKLSFKEDELFTIQYCKFISTITFSEKKGYYYFVPDFTRKYPHDHFETYYLLFQAAKGIKWSPTDSLYMKLLTGLSCSLFDLYKDNLVSDSSKLSRFKALCGKELLQLKNLSPITKLIYLLPLKVSHELLKIKGKQ